MRRAKRPALRLDVESANRVEVKRFCAVKANDAGFATPGCSQHGSSSPPNSGDCTPVLDSPSQSGLIPSPGFPSVPPPTDQPSEPPALRRAGSSGLSQSSLSSQGSGCLSPSPSSPAIQSSSILYGLQYSQQQQLLATASVAVSNNSKCETKKPCAGHCGGHDGASHQSSSATQISSCSVAHTFDQELSLHNNVSPSVPSGPHGGAEIQPPNQKEFPNVARVGSSRFITFAGNMKCLTAPRETSPSESPCAKYLVGRPFKVWDSLEKEFKVCQPISVDGYRHFLALNQRLAKPPADGSGVLESTFSDQTMLGAVISPAAELILNVLNPQNGEQQSRSSHCGPFAFLITACSYGDLHSYIRQRRRLPEGDIKNYFGQIARLTAFCHARGVLLRDMKLRKFVFSNPQRTLIRLDNVVDLRICPTPDEDTLTDRHGCPAYVSPELLTADKSAYAGRPADVWSMGVLLYVMSFSRYPFYDSSPSGLFGRIRAGQFCIPREVNLSMELRFLICSLLRHDPSERPKAEELLASHWFNSTDCQFPERERWGKHTNGAGCENDDGVVPFVEITDG